jgi:hypothetical protein
VKVLLKRCKLPIGSFFLDNNSKKINNKFEMYNTFNNHTEVKESMNKLTDFVSYTFGVNGIGVGRFEQSFTTGQYMGEIISFDDGYVALKSLRGKTTAEKLALSLLQANAFRVSQVAGDGTTTSCLILNHLYGQVDFSKPLYEQKQEFIKSKQRIMKAIEKYRNKDTKHNDTLFNLALSVSKNNHIAETVSKIFKETNGVGNVIPQMSIGSSDDIFEIGEGVILNNLLLTPELNIKVKEPINSAVMITNCNVLTLAHIDMVNILHRFYDTDIQAIVLFCMNLSQEAKSEIILHNSICVENKLPYILPLVPDYSDNADEIIEALCAKMNITKNVNGDIVSGNFNIREGLSFKSKYFQDTQFGFCKILPFYSKIKEESKFIFTDTNDNTNRVEEMIKIVNILKSNADASRYSQLNNLLSILTGKYIDLQICGSTSAECSEKWERYDDTIKAYRSAMISGVVEGGGKFWYSLSQDSEIQDIERSICKCIISKLRDNNSYTTNPKDLIYDTFPAIQTALDISYSTVISNIVPYYSLGQDE